MSRDSIKLDRPLMSQERWLAAAYECDLWWQEGMSDEPWPEWLVKQTRRLGKRRLETWLTDDGVNFNDQAAGLGLAEHCGMA